MKYSSALTSRDKKLLYFLLFVVIIFIFGWCMIRPLYKKIVATSERIEIESALKNSNEAKVLGLSSARISTERFENDYNDSVSVYYDHMDSSEIDKLVTTYILQRGLTARSLTITIEENTSLRPYTYSDLAERRENLISLSSDYEEDYSTDLNTSSENTATEDDEEKKSYFKDAIFGFLTGYESSQITMIASPTEEYTLSMMNAGITSVPGIDCVHLEIVVEGDEAKEQAIIDDLSKNPSVLVTGFSWITLDPITYLQEDGSLIIYQSPQKQLQISVDLYMKEETTTQEEN